MRVAFLGTGLMGAPMAQRIAEAGHYVRIWNRSAEKAEQLRSDTIVPFAKATDAIDGAEVVCLCLTDDKAIAELLDGPERLAASLTSDQIVLDFSTCGVEATREFASRCPARWMDCPVSGGVAGASAGELVIYAGGRQDDLDDVKTVLDAVSHRCTLMGPLGSGQAAKLCNQLIVSANLAAIAEAMALAERLGVDTVMLPRAFEGGFADSAPLRLFGTRMAYDRDPGPKVSTVSTMRKDVDLCSKAAAALDLDLPLLDAVAAAYRRIIEAGCGDSDLPALISPYREKNTSGS